MSANRFGEILQMLSFGESHGPGLGVVIEGCPAGLEFDLHFLQSELDRRKPGRDPWTSKRSEPDQVEVLSGVFEGLSLGTPIALLVRNQDAKSSDYAALATQPRAGHADDVWKLKFGHSDHRGGGRSSGRETLSRVMGGAIAKMILKKTHPDLKIRGFSSQIGPMELTKTEIENFVKSQNSADQDIARFPSPRQNLVRDLLLQAQQDGESHGGYATMWVQNMPQGLGQPVFRKLKSDLAQALMSIGATAQIEIGDFDLSKPGTNFHSTANQAQYGGIRGGISTGEDLVIRVGFKPTSSILDVAKKGRHDPCIIPRAIPVLEAMTAFVLADHVLWQRLDRI